MIIVLKPATKAEQEHETAAIQEGLDAIAAGRVKPLGQYLAELRAKRGLSDAWPDAGALKEVTPGIIGVE